MQPLEGLSLLLLRQGDARQVCWPDQPLGHGRSGKQALMNGGLKPDWRVPPFDDEPWRLNQWCAGSGEMRDSRHSPEF